LRNYFQLKQLENNGKGKKENHHWEINFKEIEEMSQKIGQDYYSPGGLARSFSVISENAIYVSTITLIK